MSESFGGYNNIAIPRGQLVEQDLFDQVKEEARINFEKNVREGLDYVNYERSVDLAKAAQPVHPTRPRKPFATALHDGVVEKLYGKVTLALAPKVKFYTGVGSALDYFHGTDGFMEIDKDSGLVLPNSGRITLGITTRNKGDEPRKTDIEIWVPEEGLDNGSELFHYAVRQVVEEILRVGQGNPGSFLDVHE